MREQLEPAHSTKAAVEEDLVKYDELVVLPVCVVMVLEVKQNLISLSDLERGSCCCCYEKKLSPSELRL